MQVLNELQIFSSHHTDANSAWPQRCNDNVLRRFIMYIHIIMLVSNHKSVSIVIDKRIYVHLWIVLCSASSLRPTTLLPAARSAARFHLRLFNKAIVVDRAFGHARRCWERPWLFLQTLGQEGHVTVMMKSSESRLQQRGLSGFPHFLL